MNSLQLENQISSFYEISKSYELCFTIGSLSHFDHAENFYITPIRYIDKFAYMGVIVKIVEAALEIGKKIDGKAKYIFVDSEKKILKESYGPNDSGNVEKALKNIIKKSELLTYKGNDLTFRAADSLLRVLVPDLSGAKISVIGIGNIGTKIALSLLERGNDIFLYSSDVNHAREVSDYLNKIKFRSTIARCSFALNLDEAFVGSNVVIGCSDKKAEIGSKQINLMSPKSERNKRILVDIGKGSFKSEVNVGDQVIYRVDIENELSSEIVNLIKLFNQFKSISIKEVEGIRFVKKGIVGNQNDIIVDSLDFPTRIIGKCDGQGNLSSISNEESQLLLAKLIHKT